MFKLKNESKLDKEIDNLIESMHYVGGDTEEYSKMAANLVQLYKAKSMEREPQHISYDTLASIAGNLAGIILILKYEELNAITSKALSFVMKPKA